MEAGSTMLLDGFNFPELIYRIGDDLSYEWLNISFAKNGTINESDVWELDQNYTLTVSDIDLNGEKVTLELAKNSDVVEFTVIGEGDTFEYKTDIESTDDVILFTCKVDTVLRGTDSNIVVLKTVIHYSDTPLILKTGDKFSDFSNYYQKEY